MKMAVEFMMKMALAKSLPLMKIKRNMTTNQTPSLPYFHSHLNDFTAIVVHTANMHNSTIISSK
jgi:hypothetical protein